MEPKEKFFVRQRLSKHVPAVTNTHTNSKITAGDGVFYRVRAEANLQCVEKGK
jgi:hypothetical protein